MSKTATAPCDYCGAKSGRHVKGCVMNPPKTPQEGVLETERQNGAVTIDGTTGGVVVENQDGEEGDSDAVGVIDGEVDGERALIDKRRPTQTALDIDDGQTYESASRRVAECKSEEARLHTIAKKSANAYREGKARTEAAVDYLAEFANRKQDLHLYFSVPREDGGAD